MVAATSDGCASLMRSLVVACNPLVAMERGDLDWNELNNLIVKRRVTFCDGVHVKCGRGQFFEMKVW